MEEKKMKQIDESQIDLKKAYSIGRRKAKSFEEYVKPLAVRFLDTDDKYQVVVIRYDKKLISFEEDKDKNEAAIRDEVLESVRNLKTPEIKEKMEKAYGKEIEEEYLKKVGYGVDA